MGRNRSCYAFEGYEAMCELVEQGKTNRQIADALGISIRTVAKHKPMCGAADAFMHNGASGQHMQAMQALEEATRGTSIEYVRGPVKASMSATFRCRSCGHEFSRQCRHVRQGRTWCPACAAKERKAEREDAKRLSRIEQKTCPECGEAFTYERVTSPKQFCSKRCMSRYHHRKADRKRRNAPTDGGPRPTWRRLYKMGQCACHICGELVDPDDYEIRDGVFIAGKRFPSLDHYVALANGGADSYSNAKMAHRLCNSLKRDIPMGEYTPGAPFPAKPLDPPRA